MVIPSDITRWGFRRVVEPPHNLFRDSLGIYHANNGWRLALCRNKIKQYQYVSLFHGHDKIAGEIVSGPHHIHDILKKVGYLEQNITNANEKSSW